jgi:hypothetical protein
VKLAFLTEPVNYLEMHQIKYLLLFLILVFNCGSSLADPTFFNWHGITIDTDYKKAERIVIKQCDRMYVRDGDINGEDCGRHPEFGVNTSAVAFSYKGFFTKKITGLTVTTGPLGPPPVFDVLDENIGVVKKAIDEFFHIWKVMNNSPFYEEDGKQSCGSTYSEATQKFTNEMCGANFKMLADPKKSLLMLASCSISCGTMIMYSQY